MGTEKNWAIRRQEILSWAVSFTDEMLQFKEDTGDDMFPEIIDYFKEKSEC